MHWPWTKRLVRLVDGEDDVLQAVTGRGARQLRDLAADHCEAVADIATIAIIYDRRDQWLLSSVHFTGVEEAISLDSLTRFLSGEEPASQRGPLAAPQVRAELQRLARVLDEFRKHPAKVKQAEAFFHRENEEYTRRMSL